MRAGEKEQKDSTGSMTVEAVLFLIPFMMAFFTIINGARFVEAEMLIHHAVTQTAKQISAYSYVITKAGIAAKMQETDGKSRQFTNDMDKAVTSIEGFADAVSDPGAVAEGVFSWVKSGARQALVTQLVGQLSKENIRNSISLVSDDPDKFLTNVGIVGGLSGLHFSCPNNGEGDIQIMVTYTMKNQMFPDFDFGQYEFCQCASTSIW